MNPPQNRPVAITLRLYRVLARAFPYEFKNAYGDELVQMTEDAVESIWRQHGILGLVRLLADIAIRVPAEHFAEFSQDVRYGLRMLAGSPGFTAVALLSLGIGIGIGSSAFSFISATILRDVPAVQKPHELVSLRGRASYPNYRHYRDRSDLFSSTLAYTPAPFGISFSGPSHRIWGHLVTPSYFPALGVRPALGSAFAEEHEKPGAQPAVVVSHRFWQVHLGSDSSAIGKSVRINGQPCLLIGVAPKEFLGASPMILPADVWLPISAGERVAPELADNALDRRSAAIFQMVARLQPGVTLSRAEAELDTIAQRLEQAFGDVNRNQKGRRVLLVTGGRLVPFRPENLPMLLGFPMVLVGLMLLIACSNVANMMLARAGARRREIAVRLALGASRARLIRQLLTESMMLAGAAGALALVFAVWYMQLLSGTDVLRTALGSTYPAPVDSSLAPDVRVLLFTLALAVFTGLAFGLMPAFQATRADLTPALKNGGAVQFRKYGRWSVRNLLVLSQVAGSLTLLLLTAVLTIGYQRSLGVEVGFNPRNLHVIAVDPVRDGYSAERAVAFFGTLLERVKRLPSVTAAAVTGTQPMSAPPPSITFAAAAEPGSTRAIGNADKLVIGKDYFSTLGIPLLAGREFRREDEVSGATAVIVSERVVRESLAGSTPGDSPVGRRIEIASQTFEIVGVVANAKLYFALEEARPVIYFPMRPENYVRPSLTGVTLVVRDAQGADALSAVRREISAMDANLAPFNAAGMPELIDRVMFVFRLAVRIHGFEGLFGLILASLGLAGMTAYSIVQRRREIGIRIALGARSADVLRLVMQEGAMLVAAGTALGLVCAWAGLRVLSGFFSFVSKPLGGGTSNPVLPVQSPAILIGAPLLLAGVALLACYLPARRSTRIDPVIALRHE